MLVAIVNKKIRGDAANTFINTVGDCAEEDYQGKKYMGTEKNSPRDRRGQNFR